MFKLLLVIVYQSKASFKGKGEKFRRNFYLMILTDKIECLLPNSLLGSRMSPSKNISSLLIWLSKSGCSDWSMVVCWEQPVLARRSLADLFCSLLQVGEEGKLLEEVWGGWKLHEDSFLRKSFFLCCLALMIS